MNLMKLIDTKTGQSLKIGKPVISRSVMFATGPDGNTYSTGEERDESYVVEKVKPNVSSAEVTIRMLQNGQTSTMILPIHYKHPKYPFQRVVFIPT